MSPKIRLTIPLAQAHQTVKCGHKAASLAKLISAGLHVPRGFVIVSDAYQWHLWSTGARRSPAGALDAEAREAIRDAILTQPIAEDVWSAVSRAYRELALQCGESEPKVAVRASAVQDFPGAYDSYLNVQGLEELETAIKRVWASVWNGRAAAFRSRLQPSGEPSIAVIVQRMSDRLLWGVVYTVNPVTGDPNQIVV
ncbi:MAG: PEP/pyruvate-binding domain-containing protein, partial [Armatimonadetes bacterium]|nr:PEP/pyruvate-binding domain-containing protein [Armatimonadota bacterium]